MNIIKSILKLPLKIIYYSIVALVIIIGEWILNKDLTLKQSIKEFFKIEIF